ncbi:uncharacterized protein LOC103723198 isoform X1 [Phoenix dactylifera]|uniref:Uncharacterized protein LOC103723198 isoform X1 n=1 Tax=Phoenix dactylifera TaxID=42345 RepID=A0A8B8ZNF9_PHODC|nr:uncharacterized protein LOC103723198 isoform X1 [Phoenix dactylifera]
MPSFSIFFALRKFRLPEAPWVERRMSSRPVPRRESPWGLPEGDTRQPQAHRCNDRVEDVIQFQVLSSSFGDACGRNLGRSQPNLSTTCSWIHQREKRQNLSDTNSPLQRNLVIGG